MNHGRNCRAIRGDSQGVTFPFLYPKQAKQHFRKTYKTSFELYLSMVSRVGAGGFEPPTSSAQVWKVTFSPLSRPTFSGRMTSILALFHGHQMNNPKFVLPREIQGAPRPYFPLFVPYALPLGHQNYNIFQPKSWWQKFELNPRVKCTANWRYSPNFSN